jgi:hypothetical protein
MIRKILFLIIIAGSSGCISQTVTPELKHPSYKELPSCYAEIQRMYDLMENCKGACHLVAGELTSAFTDVVGCTMKSEKECVANFDKCKHTIDVYNKVQ